MPKSIITSFDQGISNITTLLKSKGMYDNTLIIFTTVYDIHTFITSYMCLRVISISSHSYIQDNGVQASAGGSNWPLRGNKETGSTQLPT